MRRQIELDVVGAKLKFKGYDHQGDIYCQFYFAQEIF
jgi:hypothetical protein